MKDWLRYLSTLRRAPFVANIGTLITLHGGRRTLSITAYDAEVTSNGTDIIKRCYH